MLDESGGVVTRTQDFEAGRTGFQPGRVADHHPCEQKQRGGEFSHNAELQFPRVQRHDESDADRITDYKAPSAEEAASPARPRSVRRVVTIREKVSREMTKAQWAALPRDCKAVRSVGRSRRPRGIPVQPHNGQ